MLEQMGYDTGVDLKRLLAASDLATRLTGTAPRRPGQGMVAGTGRRIRDARFAVR